MNLETIEVDVTQEIIDSSRHKAICACPVANAIKRSLEPPNHFPKIDDASVHLEDGFCTLHERDPETKRIARTLYHFDLPTIARNLVAAWDAEGKVQPIKFSLQLESRGVRENMVPSSV